MNNVNRPHPLLTRAGTRLGHTLLIVFTLTSVSACGMVDYSREKNQFVDSARKERALGVIHFRYGEEQPYDVTVHKIRRGYAMSAPMYEVDSWRVNFTASRDSESGKFLGLRSRWEF